MRSTLLLTIHVIFEVWHSKPSYDEFYHHHGRMDVTHPHGLVDDMGFDFGGASRICMSATNRRKNHRSLAAFRSPHIHTVALTKQKKKRWGWRRGPSVVTGCLSDLRCRTRGMWRDGVGLWYAIPHNNSCSWKSNQSHITTLWPGGETIRTKATVYRNRIEWLERLEGEWWAKVFPYYCTSNEQG